MIDDNKHENQLCLMKKQVKAIMEEAVMKKFIHEESPSVLQLCATVEQCLLDGVKRRAGGFMRSNKLANLYAKVGKAIPAVHELIKQIEEAEAKVDGIIATVNGHKSTGKHIWVRMALTTKLLDRIADYLVQNNSKFYQPSSIMADPVRGRLLATLLVGPCTFDYTKLKTQDHYWTDPPADELLQRHKLHSRARPSPRGKRPTLNLAPLHPTSSSDSLDCNACFREYVESLHQNSKISLLYGKNNVVIKPEEIGPVPGYLSLHQEGSRMMIKWTPNQLMQEEEACIQGKLTENNGICQNENAIMENQSTTKFSRKKLRQGAAIKNNSKRSSSFWKFVISVDIRDIVYLHCHHQIDKGGTLVLVGQDGVQWPPIFFPPGGHLLSFLSCLENGLRPVGYLDPPLWSEKGKGKVFPRLRRRSHYRSESSSDSDDLTDFVFRVGFTSDSSNMTSSNGLALRKRSSTDINLMKSVTMLPALWSKSFSSFNKKPVLKPKSEQASVQSISRSVVIKRDLNSKTATSTTRRPVQPMYQNNQKSTKTNGHRNDTGVFESTDEYVPNLDMYTWDQNAPRHYNEPTSSQDLASSTARSGSLKALCESMRRQILFRAFYGWLTYCRHLSGVRTHLTALVNKSIVPPDHPTDASVGVTNEVWEKLTPNGGLTDVEQLSRYVYYGGVKSSHLRPLIWMYLLGHYPPGSDADERRRVDEESQIHYEEVRAVDEEIKKDGGTIRHLKTHHGIPGANYSLGESDHHFEPSKGGFPIIATMRSSLMATHWFHNTMAARLHHSSPNYNGNTAIPIDVLSSTTSIDRPSWSSSYVPAPFSRQRSSLASDVFFPGPESTLPAKVDGFDVPDEEIRTITRKNRSLREKRKQLKRTRSDDSYVPYSSISTATSTEPWSASFSMKSFSFDEEHDTLKTVLEESEKSSEADARTNSNHEETGSLDKLSDDRSIRRLTDSLSSRSESIDPISLNLTQIEKDVHRCDRNHNYFTQDANLQKLSNIMSCFVWENPEIGYVQGMCDLAAPLLILIDDESLVYSCFVKLMQRITFQKGNQMDIRLDNLRSLIQALDLELFEHLHTKNEQVPFFFCYRWFLLEFKRELSYDEDVYAVWECSWAARTCSTPDFGLFFALAMLENYRDVLLENDMDFPAIVKFFNEMAEKHDAPRLLQLTRKLIYDVQCIIQK